MKKIFQALALLASFILLIALPQVAADGVRSALALCGRVILPSLEAETGKPVVTAQNAESFRQLVTDIVTDAAQLPEQTEENANGK